jgi:hypothetical protein
MRKSRFEAGRALPRDPLYGLLKLGSKSLYLRLSSKLEIE